MVAKPGTWLFPDPPREFPGRRGLKILLRGAHVLSAGGLLGAYLFAVPKALEAPWFHATLLTGLLLLLLDLHESAAFLLQVRGLVVLVKLLLVAVLPLLGGYAAWVLGAVVLVSVVSSHAPGRVRYFLLIGRSRLTGGRSKG